MGGGGQAHTAIRDDTRSDRETLACAKNSQEANRQRWRTESKSSLTAQNGMVKTTVHHDLVKNAEGL